MIRRSSVGPDPAHDTAYFDALPDVLDRALKALPAHRYDAIVVDEGQDLDQEWWLPLLDLLRDRVRGIVYVFGDANQDLYHARQPDELGVVMPESPPTFYLTENRHPRRPSTTSPCASARPMRTRRPGRPWPRRASGRSLHLHR